MKRKNKVVVYQAKSGAIELREDLHFETILATQAEMARIFGVNPQAITKHLKNIYKEKELSKNATCSILEHVQIEGNRKVKRSVEIYNLDAIISVGYRIGSKMGTRFRKWATKTLHQHIVDGYTINKKRLAKNYELFLKAVEQVKILLPSGGTVGANDALELIKMFANTWFSLDAYDKENFPKTGTTKKEFKVTAKELMAALLDLKIGLTNSGQAGDLFGIARKEQSVDGILGNVLQSFGGKDLYPTIEEKAAHLLYFTVKNHPFVDGNKRSGAFTFVWFLKRTGILNPMRMTPEALTALTLLVAESNPKEKDRMIGLILLILK
ncbi:MAG: virulence protein RhuM/Fic/DOC family protein [Candidatus Peregrinibacteria bacterium]|nr:virulence protein RhuM/Fic/DOC family protein [Candidatus Peregrinibacteria bacterium]